MFYRYRPREKEDFIKKKVELPESAGNFTAGGDNWFELISNRTRLQPIRTASEIQVKIIIQPLERIPLYQKISKKVAELHLLDMSHKEISESLKISEKTSKRAWKYHKSRISVSMETK